MHYLQTFERQKPFHYDGCVQCGTTIYYGNSKNDPITVAASEYSKLIKKFSGHCIPLAATRNLNRPRESLGGWLEEKGFETAIASYVGPILVHEGKAFWCGHKHNGSRGIHICIAGR